LPSDDTDDRLHQSATRGNADASRQLFDRYAPWMLAVALRILRRREDAEEVVNDVFFELFKSSSSYTADRGSMRSYLVMLTRSRSIDALRRRVAGIQRKVIEPVHATDYTVSAAPGPHDDAVSAELRAQIKQIVAGLPPDEREAIEAAFYEGLTHVQIADATGQPLGTVKGRLRRAMIRMHSMVRTLYGGPPQ
jgi:RNA polymerase sigma-70 factor, ECF subfamily